jgi:hypothetical protein
MAIVSIEGLKGTAKSTFAATWRQGEVFGPDQDSANCFWFDFDAGARRALINVRDWEINHEIWHPATGEMMTHMLSSLKFVRGGAVQGQMEIWDSFVAKYGDILAKMTSIRVLEPFWKPQVLIMDTFKYVWQVNTQAYLQGLQGVPKADGRMRTQLTELEYAIPNLRMENMIALAGAQGFDLLLISHLRPQYMDYIEDGKKSSMINPDGSTEIDGWRHLAKKCDWQIEFEAVPPPPAKTDKFTLTITKSPVGQELVGEKLSVKVGDGKILSYAMLKELVESKGKQLI